MRIYTMENLRTDFDEAQCIVYGCGLHETEEIDYHLELVPSPYYLGQTHKSGYHNYIIRLNQLYAKTEEHDSIINVLVHEILHSLKDGMSHTGAWKRYASIVYIKKGINITRCAEINENSNYKQAKIQNAISKNPNKMLYQIICPNCGILNTLQRKTSTVTKIASGSKSFYCKKCHSKDLKVKEISPSNF